MIAHEKSFSTRTTDCHSREHGNGQFISHDIDQVTSQAAARDKSCCVNNPHFVVLRVRQIEFRHNPHLNRLGICLRERRGEDDDAGHAEDYVAPVGVLDGGGGGSGVVGDVR